MEQEILTASQLPTASDRFFKLVRSPLRFRLFLLSKLPAALFSGVNVRNIDASSAEVSIRYRWFTRNPFRSTYFASLSMAAEMSTGLLAMSRVFQADPPVSLLVVRVDGEFLKKAKGLTVFKCIQGDLVDAAIARSFATGDWQPATMISEGTDQEGNLVARFNITWSFRVRNSNQSIQ